MRLLNLFQLALLFALFSLSCTKTTTKNVTKTVIDSVITTTYPDYMALKPGNWWVYQTYRVFSADSAVPISGSIDSNYVVKDTLIGSYTYHIIVMNQGGQQTYFLRDSLSYTVSIGGGIFFSSQDFTTIFLSTPYINPNLGINDTILFTEQMGFKDSLTKVPVGVFPTCTYRQVYHINPPIPMEEHNWKYAKNIGLISRVFYFSPLFNLPWYEDRLIRFHVQ